MCHSFSVIEVVGTDEFEDWFLGLNAADGGAVARLWRDQMKLHKWKDVREKKFSPEQLQRIDDEVQQELLEMDLRMLREAVGLTQEELARRVEVTQSQLSKLERREDYRLSTLRRYVKALGGEVEIFAVIEGKKIRLSES